MSARITAIRNLIRETLSDYSDDQRVIFGQDNYVGVTISDRAGFRTVIIRANGIEFSVTGTDRPSITREDPHPTELEYRFNSVREAIEFVTDGQVEVSEVEIARALETAKPRLVARRIHAGTEYANSYPARDGGNITQGHADYCAAHSHHTENGALPYCARCGENVTVSLVKTPAEVIVNSARLSGWTVHNEFGAPDSYRFIRGNDCVSAHFFDGTLFAFNGYVRDEFVTETGNAEIEFSDVIYGQSSTVSLEKAVTRARIPYDTFDMGVIDSWSFTGDKASAAHVASLINKNDMRALPIFF
ncbi:hypothetical protein GMA3_96 [Gordonia phage GMA3]|uniref:Uncharacterized protein n=1 Tax=Gordonia phage GMA3 TaxID=1647284 RepID=A0A0K0NL15_9CAUD|nr:hypothetical protein AU105_gp096 [Gordonia phage GMA3]AKL88273.1 hypothetical protein GMA3_96 [Gordonia phage GMA3]